jgi:flagellar biosynthesis/type III secretory pathway protein FliH
MAKEETPEEYKERLRRSREEQLESQARRKQEAIARKARQEIERGQGRSAIFNTLFIIHFNLRALGSREKAKKQNRGKKGSSGGSP